MATVNLGRIKPVFKGAYAGGTAFVVDDIVTSGNETFICIQASTGNATSNATYWTKLASKGADGTNGSNGTDLSTTLTTRGDLVFRNASTLARLPKGTNGYFLKQGANDPEWGAVDLTNLSASNLSSGTIPNARYGTPTFNGSNITNLSGFSLGTNYLQARINTKTGMSGGNWNTLEIGNITNSGITGASLANGDLTLPAGTYYCDGGVMAKATESNALQLYNVTDSNDNLFSGMDGDNDGAQIATWVPVMGWFTISGTKTLRWRIYTQNGGASLAPAYANGYAGKTNFWKL